MRSFDDSITQMLWPEKRERDAEIGSKLPQGPNGLPLPSALARTTTTSYLRVAKGYLPDGLRGLIDPLSKLFPWLFKNDEIEIGPIPEGAPVNLLANLDLLGESSNPAEKARRDGKVLELLLKIKHDLKAIPQDARDKDAQARRVFANIVDPMLELSKCPDFIINRGHYFGTSYFKEEPGLSDDDKYALIEFLKTF